MLIRHSMFYMVARLVPGMIGTATTALLTRLLNPSSYGLYGLALAVMTFGSSAVFEWLGVSFLRFHESRRGDPLVVSTVVQIFIVLLLASAVITVTIWASGLVPKTDMAVIATGILMMWASGWFELFGKFEIANFRPARYLTMNLGRGLLIMVGAGTAAWFTRSAVWTSVGTAAGTVLAAGLLRSRISFKVGRAYFDRELAHTLLAFGLPMAVAMGLATLVMSGTRVLVQILDSAQALGIYTACYLIVQNTIGIASGGVASAAYQLAVRAVETGDLEQARRQLLNNGTLLIAVIAPAAIGMTMTAHGIASTLVGAQFVDGVTRLTPWMAATAFFYALRAHHFDHAFQLGKRPSVQITVAAVSASVAMGLSFLLIPKYGAVGACIATTVAMALGCAHAYFAGRWAFPVPIPYAGAMRVFIACAVMAAVVSLLPDRGLFWFIAQATAGAISYAVAALALNVVGSRDALVEVLRRQGIAWRTRPSRQGG